MTSTATQFVFKQLVGGEWADAADGGTWDLLDPATEGLIKKVPFGGRADAEAAVDAAAGAFPAWSHKTPYERGEVLTKAAAWIRSRADDLARVTTEESGKPLAESKAEWTSACGYLEWFAAEGPRAYGRVIPARVPTRRIEVIHQPLGVVGTITAWNFPVYNLVRSWAAALAAGCTVVGRPSEYTPRSAMLLARALVEGGAPAGVINVVSGDPAEVADVLMGDARVRKVAFTGSPRVGKLLMDRASETVTRLSLELGGNAPVLVFGDVDVEEAARLSVLWKTRNCGQVCVSPQRFYVHESVYERFAERVTAHTAALKMGHGLSEGTQVGPLINGAQRERVERLVEQTLEQGARLETGGTRPGGPGYFYTPTVLSGVVPGMAAHDEEIFGPVMPLIPFSTPDEALGLANSTEYGLAAFVLTNDLNTSILMSEGLEAGLVCVNDWLPATPEAPFGGAKGSGFGRETGSEGLLEYMETKTIFTGGVLPK